MREIGIGVIGTGFMGKAHAIAYSASASVFGTPNSRFHRFLDFPFFGPVGGLPKHNARMAK